MVMDVESCDANGTEVRRPLLTCEEELQVESMLSPIYERVCKLDRRFCLLSSGCEQTNNAFRAVPEAGFDALSGPIVVVRLQ
jgi:hypothetical protein